MNMDQILQRNQIEGNEAAMFALIDNPTMMAAVDAAVDAGARWSRVNGEYWLHEPGREPGTWEMNTLAIIFPADDTADFGSSIQKYLLR